MKRWVFDALNYIDGRSEFGMQLKLRMKHKLSRLFRTAALASVMLLGGAMVSGMAGCSTAQSTRLTASDFDLTIEKMVQSLAASDFLKERRPDSSEAWVVINKVENLTTDIIPVSEQWMLVARLQTAVPVKQLADTKNIRFQITPERHAMLREAGFTDELITPPTVTHTLQAVFMSAPRAARSGQGGQLTARSDFYYLEYSLLELQSREVVWTDTFEIKREARGLAID